MKEDDGLKNSENKQLPPQSNCLPESLLQQMSELTQSNHRLSEAVESLVAINSQILETLLDAFAPEGQPDLGQTLDG